MQTSRRVPSLLLILAALVLFAVAAFADDPGEAFSNDSQVSDQKAGSVLFYNVFTSSPTGGALENTAINITNTSATRPVFVHLFFIDGASCGPADNILCLTQNQTIRFLTSDIDPGTSGYMVAVAVDSNGWPANHNFLIGDEYVKFASGHTANLGAEAVSALELPEFDQSASFLTLNFDGTQFNRLPYTLALSNLPSAADGNNTLFIINRVSGNWAIGADGIGSLFGILYSDTENPYSYQLSTSQCQLKFVFSNTTVRTTPRFMNIVPAGRTGWTKFYSNGGAPLLGAAINFNPNAANSATFFNQGHNFHKLTFTTSSATIPVFPPSC